MRIGSKTFSILKNFSSINPSIYIPSGDVISTVSPRKSVMARATVEETFPEDFAIYDLSRFLGVVSLLKDPVFDFNDQYVDIKSENQTIRYTYTDPDQIVTPSNKEVKLPDPEIEFVITGEELQNVLKAGAVLQLPEISVQGEDGKIFVASVDSKGGSTDNYRVEVGETPYSFNMIFKTENFKMLHTTYNVSISSQRISKFTSEDVTYWVAAEAESSFEE